LFFPCIYNICGIFYNIFRNINLLCVKIWHLKFYLERCKYNFAIIAHFFLYIQGHILVKFIEITWSRYRCKKIYNLWEWIKVFVRKFLFSFLFTSLLLHLSDKAYSKKLNVKKHGYTEKGEKEVSHQTRSSGCKYVSVAWKQRANCNKKLIKEVWVGEVAVNIWPVFKPPTSKPLRYISSPDYPLFLVFFSLSPPSLSHSAASLRAHITPRQDAVVSYFRFRVLSRVMSIADIMQG